ncbi:MAG: hypothetical protein SF097_09840 [Acidobacteriota bacterium]|nr:hypothetical protein [Acidobacteriota bacterium]
MEMTFQELIARLVATERDNLVSVIVYGSAIAAPGNAKKSDYQLTIVTRHLTATDLRHVRSAVEWWAGQGFTLPTFFTAAEFTTSLDVFPIEFRQIKRAYRVLYGEDLLAAAEISMTNLRLETESELRGKLLRLRSLAIPASQSANDLTKLMTESIVSFVRYLRPMLELLGEEPPLGRLATVNQLGERLKLDTSPLIRVLHLRDEPKDLLEIEAQDLFSSYLNCLTHIVEAVDKL